jgi:hypothetical protein
LRVILTALSGNSKPASVSGVGIFARALLV